jgi:hypothetical protein
VDAQNAVDRHPLRVEAIASADVERACTRLAGHVLANDSRCIETSRATTSG